MKPAGGVRSGSGVFVFGHRLMTFEAVGVGRVLNYGI